MIFVIKDESSAVIDIGYHYSGSEPDLRCRPFRGGALPIGRRQASIQNIQIRKVAPIAELTES